MSAPPRRAPADVLVHLRRARDHADRHHAEPLDLAALAAVAGLSEHHGHPRHPERRRATQPSGSGAKPSTPAAQA